ncbi:MAG TPA: AAA family ATPase [Chthonomonadaceae bacterium]|nr:AAA family ATPase [Chthonomonadaceae bacterium]
MSRRRESGLPDATFLTRVALKNYKSIASCNISMRPLMFLVGPNGAGKSNFLDALRFVSDALNTSLDHALRQRNGIKEVRRRSGGHPTHFSIRLDFKLRSGQSGHYSFRVGARPQGGYEVQSEECLIHSSEVFEQPAYYRVDHGQVRSSEPAAPATISDRLYLVSASGLPPFRPVYDALSRMAFYNLNPERIRDLQQPDAGERLTRDGDNIASVVAAIAVHAPEVKARIQEYLGVVVPGVSGVDTRIVGPKETLEFRQEVAGSEFPWRFMASSMSDGTLRALGVLVALFQTGNGAYPGVPLIGIEEPEVALHPAAFGALIDGLMEASEQKQILVTSHSPDLLDNDHIRAEDLIAVVAAKGVSQVGPIDAADVTALRDHLYTAGSLLRMNQLAPDQRAIRESTNGQMKFFELEEG